MHQHQHPNLPWILRSRGIRLFIAPPLGLVVLLVALSQGTFRLGIVPFFPELRETFGVGNAEVGFLFSATSLALLVFQLPAGLIADRVSGRLILTLALSGAALSALAFVLTDTWPLAVASRVVMGFCIAWIVPAIFQMVSRAAHPDRQAQAFSFFEMGMSSATFVALALAPLAAAWFDLRGTHYVLVGVAMLAVLMVRRYTRPKEGVAAPEMATGGDRTVTRRSPYDGYSVVRRLIVLIGMTGLAVLPIGGVLTWLPTYLQDVMGYTIPGTGAIMGVLTGTSTILAYLSGRWADRISRLLLTNVGGLLVLGSLVLLLLPGSPNTLTLGLIALLAGCGIPLVFTPLMAFTAQIFGAARAGMSSATMLVTAQLSSFSAGTLYGWMIDATGGFTAVWLIGIACLLGRVAVSRLIREQTPAVAPHTV